jgi:hypothetical protein
LLLSCATTGFETALKLHLGVNSRGVLNRYTPEVNLAFR